MAAPRPALRPRPAFAPGPSLSSVTESIICFFSFGLCLILVASFSAARGVRLTSSPGVLGPSLRGEATAFVSYGK